MTDEEINDRVDYWHDNPELNVPLHEYLGMTWNEYKAWVEQTFEGTL